MRILLHRATGIVAAVCAVAVASCADGTNATPGSSVVAPSAGSGNSLISVCHRETGANAFARILVEAAALASHISHGDGRPGRLVPGQPDAKFSPDCAAIQLVAATIGLAGLKINGAPFTALQESGFTVSAKSGPWEALTTYGYPQPSLIFRATYSMPAASAEIQVTADGELFVFGSIDLYSSTTPIPHTIIGRVEAADSFTISGTVPNTFGKFATVLNPNPPMMIETLIVRIVNPAAPCCPNPSGLDNIVLKR